MDRNREARRVSMAASNGLSRRRHRSNSLRDSAEDDGPLELQETVRLRDRGPGKKDRDRDRERDHRERDREKDRDRDRMSSRSKRRRGDRMMHGSNREDGGDDSSEESVNDEEDEDDDDGSGVGAGPGGSSMRMLPPNPTSFSSSSMSNHHHRKSFPPPAKVFRTGPTLTAATPPTATTPSPNATPWKAPDEMIGVSVPRKARSASTKRSHECWASSGGGVVGGEQIHRQASTSPARSSGPGAPPMFASASPSPAPVSPPSSSNASVKKKMKPNGPKPRLPKSSTKSVSSAQDEIEIEIAQVLFGLGRQPHGTAKQEIMGNDSIKFDSRDVNNNINKSSFHAKSRVSSPISNSPSTITLAPSSIPPTTNSSSSATPMSAIAPRRKRPRPVKYEEENPSAYPVRNSLMSLTSKVETDQPAKIDVSSPNLVKNSIDNGGISYDLSANQVAQVSAEPKPEAVKPENNTLSESKPMAEESAGRDLTVNREEPRSPKKEPSSGLRLDCDRGSLAGTKGNSAISESENHREEKFQIDLMAPPPSRSSPERDSEIDFVAIDAKKPKLQDVEMEMKPVVKDDEKKAVKFGKDDMNAEHVEKKTKVIAEEPEFQKPSVNRERNIDLQFDLEKSDKDNANAVGAGHKLQHHGQKPQQQQPNAEKTVQTSSLPLPMSLASWPGALPHMGYMAPLQGVVSMDGNTVSSTPIQPPHLLFNQPRPKRCATHCYIARIIQCHQQIARMNPFWPAATGSALAYGPKPCNVNVLPSPESHAGRGVNSVQDKGQGIAIVPGPAGKEKSSQPSNIVDNTQRKQILLQQALPPGAPGNILHGPAFIFPLSQQQAAASAVRPGTVKSPPVAGSGGSSSSASVSATATAVAGATAMSFNYPNLPGNETQYLAILQNGPYPIPIPAHVGATPPYRGAHTQALPFFNGSFYSSQMLHPSQLQQQQSATSQSQQSQQGHQNPSISSGSSSSQKHLQNQQQRPHGSGINGGSGNLQGFPAPKHQQSHSLQLQQRQQTQSQNVPHQARQLESELGGEDSPSTDDSRVSRSNMSIYGQNFAIPMNQPNFALMTPASMGGAGGNPGEKKQHSHAQGSKSGVEALTSQPFAMSFPSINGTSSPGFDISSIAHNHAFIQNLPEATRHSYHFMAAAVTAQTAQQKKNYRISDEGKTGGDGSNLEEERKATAAGKAPPNAAHLIAFSRPDLTDASASTMPGNTVIDSSARTLNLSSTPARASSSIMSAAISNANTPPVQQQLQRNHQQQLQQHQQQLLQQQQQQQLQQQHQMQQHQHQQMQQQQQQQQQQVIQLHKQHQFAAAAAAAASARSKAPATSNGSVYSDHLSSSPSMATKFPNTLPAFPQTLVQSSSSPVQSPQWKNSMRTTTSQIPPPSLASASPSLKNLPQQQGRTQQGHAQISFSANPKPTAVQQGQAPPSNNQSSSPPMVVGSPTTSSVSKGAGGSPRTSSSAGNKGGQSSSLSSQQAKNSPSVPAQKSSPAGGRNVPSILGHPHNAPSSSSSGTKPQLTQQQQQQLPKHAFQQAQMLYTSAYMQAQAQHAERTTNSGSAASGFYLQRHRGEHQQQPPGSSANSSSGMLSLCTPVTLANTSTTDPAKAVAAAAAVSNMKGGGLASQGLVHAQFAAAQSAGKQQHQLLPAGFSYVHPVPSTVQVKPSEQKQPAGE